MSKRTIYRCGVRMPGAALVPAGISARLVAEHFSSLVVDQNARLATDQPVSPVPLLWLALARAAGLNVEIETGRIISGPRQEL
jgi:hypothetical protein